MPDRRRRRTTRVATQAIELSLAVPEVVARRVVRMALAGYSPSDADREEFLSMGAEKISAFYESWNSVFLAVWRANLEFFLSWPASSAIWPGPGRRTRSAAAQRAALDILASGIAPIHRRAVGNAKRLRGR